MKVVLHLIKKIKAFAVLVALLLSTTTGLAQTNDNCSNATAISIPSNGFGLGNFTSAQTDLTSATVQTGETFAPAIFVAGLDKKSVWFKFSIPTIRAVRVTLTQPGTTIKAGDAGFAVYKSGNCLPTNAEISTKLTPIVTFGNTYHPCVPAGDYLIQVSSNLNANGPIIIQVEITDQTGAAYDHPNQAYAFDTVKYYAQRVGFNTECQSIEDATEICSAFAQPYEYNKSAWLTFTTPAYFDYIVIQLSGTQASYYFPSSNNQNIYRSFGYTLYKGDAVTTPIGSLTTIQGCDSIASNGIYAGYKVYKCGDLQTKTKYSLQIFINKDFADDIQIGIMVGGQRATTAPQPLLSSIPAPNAIGNLAASPDGVLTQIDDVWGCNSKHSNNNCSPSIPDTGIMYNGGRYDLSSFFTFTLTNTCALNFNTYVTQCGPQPLVRVFKQGVTTNCTSLDTANIIGTFTGNYGIDCVPPGNYTIQVSGQSATDWYARFTNGTPAYNYEQCLSNNLGTSFRIDLRAYIRKAANKYSLSATGAFDTINLVGSVMQPLTEGVSYPALPDTMGCASTLRPADTTCNPLNDKVIYRQFVVADSGIADFSGLTMPWNNSWRYRVYSGDANALASAQNVFAYPDKITGLIAKSDCFDGYVSCANKTVCVTPGTYTLTTMGGAPDVGRADKPTITFVRTRTKHKIPSQAQDLGSIMDTLGPAGGTVATDVDVWDCDDNAVPINGYTPCTLQGKPATKAIYRQFYLKEDALVRMDLPYYWYCANRAYGYRTLFYGKATDGLAGLTEVGNGWSCVQYAGSTAGCSLLPAGWYTVVSYNQGPSYDSTMRSINFESRYNSAVSYYDEFRITITPTCKGPQFNRPYKASVNMSDQPHAIQLVTRNGHSATYPKTDSTYALPTEYFNCTLDTPFANHRIKSCNASSNRVAYYVFKTTQQCFLYINAGGYYTALYNKDVRTADSLKFDTLTPMQPCTNIAGTMQYCYFQPGTYTLVIFAGDGDICKSVTPVIYADVIGYSRFDYAAKAYDFGIVPADSVYHFGKVGDVNPLNSGRKPSSDFFYCTTGAFESDPGEPVCYTAINPNVYNSGPNRPVYDTAFPSSDKTPRRNLWYTFVVDQPGYVRVHVDNKHDLRGYQPKFAVYKSNVDGSLPFSTVVSNGQVDSTAAQGLSFIGTNPIVYWPYTCASAQNEVVFYRDPCSFTTNRYYILVENVNPSSYYEAGGTLPNTQIEVSVMVDSITLQQVKHDHYSLAGDIGTVGVGKFTGDIDNFSCATKDPTDPIYYYNNSPQCKKTLWYKFTSTITGNVRYRAYINGVRKQDYYDIQLFRQIVPGDSTTTGLQIIGYGGVYGADNTYWAQTCVSPGTYYLLLPGCDQVNSNVYPEIELIENVGDFCGRAVPAAINGAGSATATALVDCHTIATDYGEFGPTLTCPEGAKTSDYKTSWFRMDIGGTDTLDVTTFIVENTNAASSDIKYRLMTGDCGAMQEQSCVLDALTQNTYQCLAPGQSYYVQVFTPITKFNQGVTGTIDLKLSAVAHVDTCAPLPNCLATANFLHLFDCTKDDSVKFINYSTYGTSIIYKWYFGYNNVTSSEVSPSFFYPALPTDSTYTVKLVVENTSCGKKDSVIKTITIPGRPYIDFGKDIFRCDGTPITLVATSHTGATYTWQDGSVADTFKVTATGNNEYRVKIDYNNCSSADTVKVLISTITSKPLQNILICSDAASISANRNAGETYKWNTGETSSSITVSNPGIYWCDVIYFDCVYRDSFLVNNANTAQPLGSDTTVCISSNGYILRATTAGAQSYQWQDGSIADTLKITAPGQYNVAINFGSCALKDTVNITGYPAPVTESIDTSICSGQSLTLPSGAVVTTAGIYKDTTKYIGGCDSLIKTTTVTINPKPNLGSDTTVCFAQRGYNIDAAIANVTSYQWQDGSTTSSYNITAPGLYWVNVNFGNCSTRDTINITGSPSPLVQTLDTSICFGQLLTLAWGGNVSTAGTYRDTIPSYTGCDSIIQVVNLTVQSGLSLGNDTSVTTCSSTAIDLAALYNTAGLSSVWTNNGTAINNPFAINTSGNYRLVAATAQGCTDTAFVSLTISPKPNLGNDTTVNICSGSIYNLNAVYNTGSNTNNWTTNGNSVNNPSAINTAGIYQLITTTAQNCSDTVLLTLIIDNKPNLVTNNPPVVCSPQTVDLTTTAITAGSSANLIFTYWQDAAATIVYNRAATATSGTWYIKGTTNVGCFDIKPVTVTYYPLPVVDAGNDFAICDKDSTILNSSVTNITTPVTYQWDPVAAGGIQSPTASSTMVKPSGTQQYILTVTDGYSCNYAIKDTIIVTMQPPVPAFAGNDTIAVIGVPQQLQASGGVNYIWSPSSLLDNPFASNPKAVLNSDEMFTVEVRDIAGCVGYDTVMIKTFADITFYVPNAFSPNGDGLNETFKPIASGIPVLNFFRVVNRYGEIVFETTQFNRGWDGIYKNKPQPVGNYVWWLRGQTSSGRAIEMKGNVVLIR